MGEEYIGQGRYWTRHTKAARLRILWTAQKQSDAHVIPKAFLNAQQSVENLVELSSAANKKLSEVREEKKDVDATIVGVLAVGLLIWMASRETMEKPAPPQRAEAVLIFMLPPNRVEEVLGDFEEAFAALAKRRGRRLAVVWYWWQVGVLGLRALSGAFTRGVKVLGTLN